MQAGICSVGFGAVQVFVTDGSFLVLPLIGVAFRVGSILRRAVRIGCRECPAACIGGI